MNHKIVLLILCTALMGACSTIDEENPGGREGSNAQTKGAFFGMALNSHASPGIKMTAANTQQDGTFQGLDSLVILPFSSTLSGDATKVSPVMLADVSLDSCIDLGMLDNQRGDYISDTWAGSHTFSSSQSRLYPRVKVPQGTRSFLAYGVRPRGGNTVSDKFAQGSTLMEGLNTGENATTAAGSLNFKPECIYPAALWASGSDVYTQAQAIISYLNTLIGTSYSFTSLYRSQDRTFNVNGTLYWNGEGAQTYTSSGGWWGSYSATLTLPSGLSTAYTNFRNNLSGVSCTASNVKYALDQLLATLPAANYYTRNNTDNNYRVYNNLLANIRTNIQRSNVTISGTTANVSSATWAGFPANLNLPEGIAVIRWNGSSFELKKADDADLNPTITTPRLFCYPAQLWYWTNTLIKTSMERDLSEPDWLTLYGKYSKWAEADGGVLSDATWTRNMVNEETSGVALIKPMNYGVARLDLNIKGANSTTLTDAAGNSFSINGAGNTNFPLTAVLLPNQHKVGFDFLPNAAEQYVVFDKTMNASMYIRQNTEMGSNYTLVLPTNHEETVKIILEFQNNSGQTIQGFQQGPSQYSPIPNGAKFYLVGEVDPTTKAPYAQDEQGVNIDNVFHSDCVTMVTATISSLTEAYNVVPDVSNPILVLGLKIDLKWKQVTPSELSLE